MQQYKHGHWQQKRFLDGNIGFHFIHIFLNIIMITKGHISLLVGVNVYSVTTHLFSIERADWPKLHDMFKARDANVWQRIFPVGYPVEVSASYSFYINIFVVARIESRFVIKAKHYLVVLLIRSILRRKNCTSAEALVQFSRVKSNELTDQQDTFFYKRKHRGNN